MFKNINNIITMLFVAVFFETCLLVAPGEGSSTISSTITEV